MYLAKSLLTETHVALILLYWGHRVGVVGGYYMYVYLQYTQRSQKRFQVAEDDEICT